MLKITVPLCPPTVNHFKEPCWRTRKGGGKRLSFQLTAETKAYYSAIAVFNHGAILPRRNNEDTYIVNVTIHWPNYRVRDVDNAGKCVLDGLVTCGAIPDDRYVKRLLIERGEIDAANPRTEIEVRYA